VASNAFVVIGVNIAAGRGLGLGNFENCNLRTIDHAVVTLEALSATHAALCFGDGLGFQQWLKAFFKVVQCLLSG
jgi:hypothetical protein